MRSKIHSNGFSWYSFYEVGLDDVKTNSLRVLRRRFTENLEDSGGGYT